MKEDWDQGTVGRLVPPLPLGREGERRPEAAEVDWTGDVGGAAGSEGAEMGGDEHGACGGGWKDEEVEEDGPAGGNETGARVEGGRWEVFSRRGVGGGALPFVKGVGSVEGTVERGEYVNVVGEAGTPAAVDSDSLPNASWSGAIRTRLGALSSVPSSSTQLFVCTPKLSPRLLVPSPSAPGHSFIGSSVLKLAFELVDLVRACERGDAPPVGLVGTG